MPAAESAAGAALGYKLGAVLGSGLIGAAVMAAFDPPKTRRELFLQAGAAGVGSIFFGPLALRVAATFFDVFKSPDLEVAVPVYFVTGALSWGAFAALAKLRTLVREKAAGAVAARVGLGE